ncbi:MAG TPA: phospholipid-binding protein, partial [Alcanivorax sp.]|nr:phospholipid-binding protein [Alcanivorax sp.]
MRHPALPALLVMLFALSGCAALTKNMAQEPVDRDHGSRTF